MATITRKIMRVFALVGGLCGSAHPRMTTAIEGYRSWYTACERGDMALSEVLIHARRSRVVSIR